MGKDFCPNFLQPFLENIDRRGCNDESRQLIPAFYNPHRKSSCYLNGLDLLIIKLKACYLIIYWIKFNPMAYSIVGHVLKMEEAVTWLMDDFAKADCRALCTISGSGRIIGNSQSIPSKVTIFVLGGASQLQLSLGTASPATMYRSPNLWK